MEHWAPSKIPEKLSPHFPLRDWMYDKAQIDPVIKFPSHRWSVVELKQKLSF